MAKPPPFQFSVAALLLVTTVVAVAACLAAAVAVPFDHPAVLGLLAAYVILLGVWAVIRGPDAVGELQDVRRRRLELAAKRVALLAEINRRRNPRSDNDAGR